MTKKKASKNGAPSRPKQTRLPGMEEPKIPEIEKLASDYAEARDERMRLGKREQDLQVLLRIKMGEHKCKRYEMEDGRVVEIIGTEKVSVKQPPKEEPIEV